MGVISITQRSERLGNLGGTSAAHGVTSTDIGQVRHTVAGTFSPRFYARNSHAGDAAIANGLGKLGDAMVRIGAAVIQREQDRKVDDYANAMMDSMEKMGRDEREVEDWDTKERRHLQGQKRGFYLRTGEGTKTLVDEWDKAFADTFRKIGESIDADDRVRERTMEKLANYRRATVSRLADHQAAEYRRMEMESAKGNLETQVSMWKNGRTEVLPDIFAQQERVDTLSLATPERRKANREALALRLTADFVGNSLDQCQTPEDFDKVEEAVKGGLKDTLPDQIADNLPGGRTVDGENRKALLEEVKKSRRMFLAERDANEREARQAVGRDFTERELSIRDIPKELWADAYENLGRDETLRKTDPKRAMAYLDAARDLRSAATKAKEKASADAVKANEEGLARAYAVLDLMKMDGSISQDDANETQAAIWRRFRTLSMGGGISPSFIRSFESRLSGQLSEQEADAMRKLYRAFGYTGEVDRKGEVPASVRKKDSTTYYAPQPDGADEGDRQKVKAAELFSFGDSLLKTLRTLGPDMDREGVVDKEIARLKTDWIKRGFFDSRIKENTDAAVRSVMDIQREAQTRWAQEEQNGTRRKEDGGRREDDKR